MKKRSLIIGVSVTILIILASLGSIYLNIRNQNLASEKAAQINNSIVNSQIVIVEEVQDLDLRLVNITNKAEAQNEINRSIEIVDNEITIISNLESLPGDEDFKKSAINLFNYYKQILENEYSTVLVELLYDKVNTLDRDDFTNQYNQIFSDINMKIGSLNSEFLSEQDKFAEMYNLQIQK